MAARPDVTPNRRGARSREVVLDAAERVMAEHGYEAATVAAIVKESGIPISSVYHYFGSKNGVLLAVMERGAARFFADLPEISERVGTPVEHLEGFRVVLKTALDDHPDFLRLLVTLAVQPPAGDEHEVHAVVNRVRGEALRRIRDQVALTFELDVTAHEVDRIARFALAAIDGAFIAQQADPEHPIEETLERLPRVMVALCD